MTSREQAWARSGKMATLASLHECDTIEGLRLTYYDWLFDLTTFIQASDKFNKRLVTSVVLHFTTLRSASVM
jgi:hypothetical protein